MGACISWACISGRGSLAGMHLKGLHLIGLHLTGLHLIGAYISQNVHLRCLYLMGVALAGTHLTGVHLEAAVPKIAVPELCPRILPVTGGTNGGRSIGLRVLVRSLQWFPPSPAIDVWYLPQDFGPSSRKIHR